jgi:hypothetical protein
MWSCDEIFFALWDWIGMLGVLFYLNWEGVCAALSNRGFSYSLPFFFLFCACQTIYV